MISLFKSETILLSWDISLQSLIEDIVLLLFKITLLLLSSEHTILTLLLESIVSFWIEYMPDFLVQRKHILNFRDSLGNQFSEDEILWFKNNYCLKKSFSYDPKILASKNKFKQLI